MFMKTHVTTKNVHVQGASYGYFEVKHRPANCLESYEIGVGPIMCYNGSRNELLSSRVYTRVLVPLLMKLSVLLHIFFHTEITTKKATRSLLSSASGSCWPAGEDEFRFTSH